MSQRGARTWGLILAWLASHDDEARTVRDRDEQLARVGVRRIVRDEDAARCGVGSRGADTGMLGQPSLGRFEKCLVQLEAGRPNS